MICLLDLKFLVYNLTKYEENIKKMWKNFFHVKQFKTFFVRENSNIIGPSNAIETFVNIITNLKFWQNYYSLLLMSLENVNPYLYLFPR